MTHHVNSIPFGAPAPTECVTADGRVLSRPGVETRPRCVEAVQDRPDVGGGENRP